MGEYERLQKQKKAILQREEYKNNSKLIHRLMPYIQHDWLCACREVKGGGCTCGLNALMEELQELRDSEDPDA